MSILTITNVGQSFGAFDLFRGATGSIANDGKVGLVGPNGVGKTTLLLILAGQEKPAAGHIHLARGATLGYLSQDASQVFAGNSHTVYEEMLTVFAGFQAAEARLGELETMMVNGRLTDDLLQSYSKLQEQYERDGGYDYTTRIKQVLTGLGFGPDKWDMILPHLSGGQKTRLLLGRLLLESPDLLILDEPTNHLDVDAIEWLEGTLKTWSGAILVVSHDRYFLDRVVNTVWEMTPVGIESYRGNYSAYTQQRQARWDQKLEAFATFQEHVAKEMDFIRRNIAGQRTQMAQGKLSRLAREVEAVHAGGLAVLGTLQSKGWAQLSNELALRRPAATPGELQLRIEELRSPVRPPTLKMSLHPSHRSGSMVLRVQNLQIGYPNHTPLFATADIQLNRLERAALIGPNGTGKSTFLRTVMGQLPPAAGEIKLGASLSMAYFAQAHELLNLENTVLDEFLRHHPLLVSEARHYLARFLFRGDDIYNPIHTLSGGERGRLALAILALQKANFLLLDEPTNHLDIPAQEALQEALEQFDGTVLLVSHDRYLVDRLATQIWELRADEASASTTNGRLRVYAGGYQAYLAVREQEMAAAKEVTQTAAVGPASGHTSLGNPNGKILSKNELRKRQEARAKLEKQIHQTEAQLTQLNQTLQTATPAQSFDRIQAISLEYATIGQQLEDLMAAWEELADE